MGRKRVARLMRAAAVQGVSRRKSTITTTRDRDARPAPDLAHRKERHRLGHRIARARLLRPASAAGQRRLHAVGDPLQERADLGVGGRRQRVKHWPHVGRGPRVHPVEHEGMEVEVQIQGRPEALDHRDRPALRLAYALACGSGREPAERRRARP